LTGVTCVKGAMVPLYCILCSSFWGSNQ